MRLLAELRACAQAAAPAPALRDAVDATLEVLAATEQARVRVLDALAAPPAAPESSADGAAAAELARLRAEYAAACAAADTALAHAPDAEPGAGSDAAAADAAHAVELGCGQALAAAALAAALHRERAHARAAALAHVHRVAGAQTLWLRDAATQVALLARGALALLQRSVAAATPCDGSSEEDAEEAAARTQLDGVRTALHARRLCARTPGAARALLDGVRTGSSSSSSSSSAGDVAGYLYTRAARRREWERRYCTLDAAAGTFAVWAAAGARAETVLDVALVASRPVPAAGDAAFELVTFRDGARPFRAWSRTTARCWLRALDAARERRLAQSPAQQQARPAEDKENSTEEDEKDEEEAGEAHEGANALMSPPSSPAGQGAAARLEWLYALDAANRVCADCGAARPEWTVLQHGCLVCIQCAGVHRALGVHVSKVRSLLLDALDTAALGLVAALGNAHAHALLEHALGSAALPLDRARLRAAPAARARFIAAKYRARAFAARAALAAPRLAARLAAAVAAGDVRLAHFLHISGAPVDIGNSDSDSVSPPLLCVAAEQEQGQGQEDGDVPVAAFLLANGAPVSAADTRTGRTALHGAAAHNRVALAAMLVRAGADLHARTRDGETPADVAARAGAAECAALLAAAAADEARDPRAQRRVCAPGDDAAPFPHAMEAYVAAARASRFSVADETLLCPPQVSLEQVLSGEAGSDGAQQPPAATAASTRKRRLRDLCTSLEDIDDSGAGPCLVSVPKGCQRYHGVQGYF